MKYKGYEAAVNFEEGDDCFVGKVINIEGPTAVVFDAQSVSELKVEFREMIDFYLETCKKKGINPKQLMSGKMILRMTPEIHAGVLSMAYTGAECQQVYQPNARTKIARLRFNLFLKGF